MAKKKKKGDKKQLKDLRAKKKAGELTARQQQRLDFLKKKTGGSSKRGTKKIPGGGKRPGQHGGQGKWSGVDKQFRPYYQDEHQVLQEQVAGQMKYWNPGYQNVYGSSQVTYDEYGNPTYTEQLSDTQQGMYDRGAGLTQMGQEFAQQELSGYTPYTLGQDVVDDRARMEGEVFDRLTKNLESDYQREREQMEQTLVNRGIPLDPRDEQYQAFVGDLDERYAEAKLAAQQEAVRMGGGELTRSAQLKQGQHMQSMNDISNLQRQGVGYQGFQGQGYQAPEYGFSNPTELNLALQKLGLEADAIGVNREQIAAQKSIAEQDIAAKKHIANQANQPQEPPLFNEGPPPGMG